MSRKPASDPTASVQLRLPRSLMARADAVARKLNEDNSSAVMRAAIRAGLPLLEQRAELVRHLEAGLPLPPDTSQAGTGLRVSDAQRAELEQVAGWYGLKAEDVLREALERGLPAVVSVTATRQAKVTDTGASILPEVAEAWIAADPQASGYHRALVEASARERAVRMKLARVAAHPDGAKALEELHAADVELRAKGILTPFGLNLNPPDKAAESPKAEPAAPVPTTPGQAAEKRTAKPKPTKGKP